MARKACGKEKEADERQKRTSVSFWVKDNRTSMVAFGGVSIFVVLLLIVLMGVYTRNLQTMVDMESYGYLEEISSQITTSLMKEMDSHYATLQTYANQVKQSTGRPLDEILRDLDAEKQIYGYRQMALIGQTGSWNAAAGARNYPDMLPFITQMQASRQPVTSKVLDLDGEDCVVFLMPMDPVTVEDSVFIGIGFAMDIKTLNNMLPLTMFDGQGYAHVVTADGSIVMRSNSRNSQFKGYNLLTYLEHADYYDNLSAADIREDFQEGRSRKVRYVRRDGLDVMAFYTPVGYEDWYLYSVIPAEVLTERSQGFYRLTLFSCAVVALIFLLMVIVIFLTQVRRKRELIRILYTDSVTQGRSMAKFELDVRQALRQDASGYSILYANIDRFKVLNEQIGRENADKLLRAVYEIIENELEEGELVSRVMADHFGILLHSDSMELIRRRAAYWDKKIDAYARSANLPGLVHLTYGAYLIEYSADAALLLDKANLARKSLEKSAPRSPHIAIFNEELERRIAFDKELEDRQEDALAAGEFRMFLQPKYNPRSSAIAGAEALVRWVTRDGETLYPDQFIPLFESNGFIVKLDLFIFEEACRFMRELIDRGSPPLPISVNLSRINLNDPDFLDGYVKVWSKYGFDASLVEFEITEGLIYDNMQYLGQVINEIHRLGFRVSMDDFGSGYSSLNMLKNVDIDAVKLDRQFFTASGDTVARASTIVRHMIELAKDLGIVVVCEGVEYEEQVEFLREQKCDLIQGYYYARPMEAELLMQTLCGALASQ